MVCRRLHRSWALLALAGTFGVATLVPQGFAAAEGPDLPLQAQVIGGVDADIEDWPFVVSVNLSDEFDGGDDLFGHFCGGSIVAPTWILSAAHCFTDPDDPAAVMGAGELEVIEGRTVLSSQEGTTHAVSRVVVHPDWLAGDVEAEDQYDIALLELTTPAAGEPIGVPATTRAVAAPPTTGPPAEDPVGLLGWGLTDEDDDLVSDRLQELPTVPLWSDAGCIDWAAAVELPYDGARALCAGGIAGQDSCLGDSGGPLIRHDGVRWWQIGVVSYGLGCGYAGMPGVYTRTPVFLEWMTEVMDSDGGPAPPPPPGAPLVERPPGGIPTGAWLGGEAVHQLAPGGTPPTDYSATAITGYWGRMDGRSPTTTADYYGRTKVAVLRTAGDATVFAVSVTPPTGTTLAVSAATPVQCYVTELVRDDETGQTQEHVVHEFGTDTCLQNPQSAGAGHQLGTFPVPAGRLLEVRFPLRSSQPLRNAVLSSAIHADWGEPAMMDPTVAVTVAGDSADVEAVRLAGADRVATAVRISQAVFDPGLDLVFVATARNFPDALTGGPVAGLLGAPILLTEPNGLPAETRAEIRRLSPRAVVVLGGTGAVSLAVEAELAQLAPEGVDRFAGANRYETAADIASVLHPDAGPAEVPVVYVATGTNFPDALAGGAAAALEGGPLLLVEPGRVPPAVREVLEDLAPVDIVVLGGERAVSRAVLDELRGYTSGQVERIAGATRYETAVRVVDAVFGAPVEVAFFATGANFPDALAGVPAAAQFGSPLLLVEPTRVPTAVLTQVRRMTPDMLVVLGGTGAVSDQVLSELAASGGERPVG